MKRLFSSLAAATLMLFIATAMAPAQEILIWDHDLAFSNIFTDPEGAGIVGCEFGVERALDQNGYSYTTLLYLPQDLSSYDVIFVITGWFC